MQTLLQLTDNNHNEATPAQRHSANHQLIRILFVFSSNPPPCEAELYKLYLVFPSWHLDSICVRWGTWFIAAGIGPAWWVVPLARHFPPLGKGLPSSLKSVFFFFTEGGSAVLERSAVFVAEKRASVY